MLELCLNRPATCTTSKARPGQTIWEGGAISSKDAHTPLTPGRNQKRFLETDHTLIAAQNPPNCTTTPKKMYHKTSRNVQKKPPRMYQKRPEIYQRTPEMYQKKPRQIAKKKRQKSTLKPPVQPQKMYPKKTPRGFSVHFGGFFW